MKRKPSKYMNKLARINIIKKSKRTYLSIVAVGLSTAIIFTSFTLFLQIYDFSNSSKQKNFGNFHYATYYEQNGPELSQNYDYTKDVNTHYYGRYQEQNFNLRTLISLNTPILPFELKEGHLPENENEIVVSDLWDVAIGERIDFKLYEDQTGQDNTNLYHLSKANPYNENYINQSFKVCGIYTHNKMLDSFTNETALCYTKMDVSNEEVYYVKNHMIQQMDSFEKFLKDARKKGEEIFNNSEIIQMDTINAYLQNQFSLIFIFILIVVLSLIISMISVHNVIIISDKDRQKELGLLKSIGATPSDIKKMLRIELFILGVLGSIAGLILGIIVAYFIIQNIIPILGIDFNIRMVLNITAMIVSLLSGFSLMFCSGFHSYKPYIHSLPINDMKDQAYQYEPPNENKETSTEKFQWKMFIIYNVRMRKQTKNLRYSFTLLLTCTTLFSSIFLSNMIYKNNYKDKKYDIDLTNVGKSDMFLNPIEPDILYKIYDKLDEGLIDIENIQFERFVDGLYSIDIPQNDENAQYIKVLNDSIGEVSIILDENGNPCPVELGYKPLIVDHRQIEELKDYVILGSLDNIQPWEAIVFHLEKDPVGKAFIERFQIGESLGPITIKAIVSIPSKQAEHEKISIYRDYKDFLIEADDDGTFASNRLICVPLDENLEYFRVKNCTEHIYMKLKNPLDASKVQSILNEIKGDYTLTNVALTMQTNAFTTFMIEILIYPLFFLLFISALINIWHVLVGNIYLKRQDISILKTVGMTNQQLYKMFNFEYLEGYSGAAFISTLILAILSLLMVSIDKIIKFFFHTTISMSLNLSANLIGALILSLAVLGALLVIPLAILSLRSVKRIMPIEFVKNIS